jgi:hypothetical protein
MENALEQFWRQPDQRILRIWISIKRRRQEDINSHSLTCANLIATLVSFLRSFGENNQDQPIREDYLPFRFIDFNSPKYQLQRKITPDTLAIARELLNEGTMPPRIVKVLYGVEGMMELLEEENKK